MAKKKDKARINRVEEKIQITFTDDVKIFDHNEDVEFEAKRGDVVSMVESSANYHLSRRSAIKGDHAEAVLNEVELNEGESNQSVAISEEEEAAALEAIEKATAAKAEAEEEEAAALEAIEKATAAKAEAEEEEAAALEAIEKATAAKAEAEKEEAVALEAIEKATAAKAEAEKVESQKD